MDRHFVPSEFQRRLVTSVADDDDAVLVNHDRLTPAELAEGRGHGVHSGVVLTRVVLVGPDRIDRPHFDIHGKSPSLFEMINVCRFCQPTAGKANRGLSEILLNKRLNWEELACCPWPC